MRVFTVFASALLMVGAIAMPAIAQDADGSKDHPMLSRMPGYVIGNYDAAMELAKALNDTGSVALYGILFDTGKATINPSRRRRWRWRQWAICSRAKRP